MRRKAYLIILTYSILFLFSGCNRRQAAESYEAEITSTPIPVPTVTNIPVLPYELLDLQEDFEEKAYDHVINITDFGIREAGSDAEASTIDYIIKYLGDSGIEAVKEEFTFQYYNLEKVLINDKEVNCDRIYLDPYNNPELSGEGEIYYQTDDQHSDIAIQKGSVPPGVLSEAMNDTNIKAVVITSADDFKQLYSEKNLQVDIVGNTEERTSSNVVAKIYSAKSDAKDIIICAHMDSIFGVGADDNASGVGAVLELAKYYYSMKDSLKYNIIFAFYGAEEVGFLGSKAYVSEHSEELSNCVLVFNMDVIGGKEIYIETVGGVQGDFADLQTPDKELSAIIDYEYQWCDKEERNYCSMIPDWLLENINNSCSELNYTYIPGDGLGSDHQMFARYGIPATDITMFGNKINTPQDTLNGVDSGAMLKAAQIVASVVNKTMMKYPEE